MNERQTSSGILRRLMCNELDQEVYQVAHRATKGIVDSLSAGVGRDLGRQASQQPLKSLRPVALQREEVLELVNHSFDDLALARGPAPIGLRPSSTRVSFGVAATSTP